MSRTPRIFFAIFVLALAAFSFSGLIRANGDEAYEDIEEAILAPDSPFYFLMNWQESIESFIANFQSEEAQANLEAKFAQRRIAEMKNLARRGIDGDQIDQLQARWQEHISSMQERAERITEGREEAKERFLEQIDRHRSVMEKVREQVPDEAKAAIDRAIENYETSREKLLENFSESRREEIEEHLKERLENTIDTLKLNRERFQELKNRTTRLDPRG